MQALRSYLESAGKSFMQTVHQGPDQAYRLWRSVMACGGHDAVGEAFYPYIS